MKDKFMKNGVFSLEYDKETLRDIVLELQEENKKQKEVIDKAIEWVRDWTQVKNDWFEEDSKPSELLDILNEVTNNE